MFYFTGALPPSTETIDENKGIKVMTEFKYNEENKMVKVYLFNRF
jgi:hypothetical protein